MKVPSCSTNCSEHTGYREGRLSLDLCRERRLSLDLLDLLNRAAWRAPLGSVDVGLLVDVRDAGRAQDIIDALSGNGLDARLRTM